MIGQYVGALVRSILVMLLVVAPAVFVAPANPDEQLVLSVIAMFSAFFIFTEYASRAPSLISFRFAAPFNRHRFGLAAFGLIFAICSYQPDASRSTIAELIQSLGALVMHYVSVTGSPAEMMTRILPSGVDNETYFAFRNAIGASAIGVWLATLVFAAHYSLFYWPPRNRVFNLWINIPTFDPTSGAGVVSRLVARARVNLLLALLMPYLFPPLVHTALRVSGTSEPLSGMTLVWIAALWSILPANFLMRALASYRIAALIRAQRTRRQKKPQPDGQFSGAYS
ncbi:MAG: hypothetical protein ACWA47_03970 [Brevirhabdus sp.]